MTIYKHVLKNKKPRLSDTFCTGRSAFLFFIMHFIKQRNQFHFERKLYAQKCVSVSVPFVPNAVTFV